MEKKQNNLKQGKGARPDVCTVIRWDGAGSHLELKTRCSLTHQLPLLDRQLTRGAAIIDKAHSDVVKPSFTTAPTRQMVNVTTG